MQTIRVRYLTRQPLVQDLRRMFPQWGINDQGVFDPVLAKEEIDDGLKKRHAYIYRIPVSEVDNTLKYFDVYALVKNSFVLPGWIQGTLAPETPTDPYIHFFMGHEIPVPDSPNEPPDEGVA